MPKLSSAFSDYFSAASSTWKEAIKCFLLSAIRRLDGSASKVGIRGAGRRRLAFESLEGRRLLAAGDLRIVSYNVIGGSGTPSADMGTVLQAIGTESYNGFARPIDVLAIQEVQQQATTTANLVNQLNAIYGAGVYGRGSLNGSSTSTEDTVGLIYNTQTVQLVNELGIGTPSTSGQPRQTIRYQLRPLGVTPTTDFYVYNSHYKASPGADNVNRRLVEAQAVRANADALPDGTHIIYAGDFNTYTSNEAGFQLLIGAGNGQAFDPLNRLGNWSNNASFVSTFTQAPAINPPGALVGGGLDDRFDFQLLTGEWTNGTLLEFIPGSYRTFGNNGTVAMNQSINNATNTALPSLANRTTILNLLTSVSDHLPVVADYRFISQVIEQFVGYVGGNYLQNFNGLPNAGTFTLTGQSQYLDSVPIVATNAQGWQIANTVGSTSVARFAFGTGSSTTGSVVSYGASNSTERALGSLATSTTIGAFGLILVNQTGSMLSSFSLSYTGEQWRNGGSGTADTLAFSYAVGADDILSPGTGSFVNAASFNFVSTTVGTTSGAIDGNAAANRRVISSTVNNLQWLAGQRLVLRWRDTDDAGSDDALAIDDLVFSASPPPAMIADRYVYYPGTVFDTTLDSQGAIDTSKTALRSGAATMANTIGYTRGITGIIVDIVDRPNRTLAASDFEFRVGNDNSPAAWPILPTTALADVDPIVALPGAGINGSSRIKIRFDLDAIRNAWLQVTVKATAATGLVTPDVFYFGSLAGDVVNNTSVFRVNASDVAATRQLISSGNANSVPVTQAEDVDKTGRVNATDTGLVRQRSTGIEGLVGLTLPTPPAARLANPGSVAAPLSFATSRQRRILDVDSVLTEWTDNPYQA